MKPVTALFDLHGRTALVTGGSRGLGLEMAEGLAEAGASVMILARREQWLGPALEEMHAKGFRAEGEICDVSHPDQVSHAVARTVDIFGKIDILVNSAGVSWGAKAEEMPLDKWRMVMDINLTGSFLFCQEVGRHMIAQRFGRIINIASINGTYGGLLIKETHAAGYVASKAGLIGLTQELAARWAEYNIRVNAIAPGYFPTRMTEKIWDLASNKMADVPMGRGGEDGEMKGVAVFLASDASNYMTGQTLVVDGGATLV
ncbi:MAG: SDR family oxidoreductase [Acidobacteria bacterium]|nr:SDR family oxidoreductase [Acidobacteriota bacterium]